MKNITVDARMINSSGIGTVIRNILKRMIVLKSEWKFYILINKDLRNKYDFLLQKNVQCIDCSAPIYSIQEQIELIKKIPKDTDVFWAPHYNIPLLYSGKLLVTVHDVFHLAMPEFVNGIHRRMYAKFMFYMVKKKADHIVCVSHFTADELQKYVGIDKDRISVIYNGIDREWFNVKLGKSVHNKPYLLYVGNVKPHKNLINLVKAFKLIKDKIPHDLVIVGKKEGFITGDKQIFDLVKDMPDRIIFTGYVEDDILKQYYKQADLFIFPSLYEGFGLPPLEALAMGTKVICSDIPALKEVCKEYVNYFCPQNLANIAEVILLNLAQKEKFTNKFSDIYQWDEIVNSYQKLLYKY